MRVVTAIPWREDFKKKNLSTSKGVILTCTTSIALMLGTCGIQTDRNNAV
jgi:hypothetical protein